MSQRPIARRNLKWNGASVSLRRDALFVYVFRVGALSEQLAAVVNEFQTFRNEMQQGMQRDRSQARGEELRNSIRAELDATEVKLKQHHEAFQNYAEGKTFQSVFATTGWTNVPPRYGQIAEIICCLEKKKVSLIELLIKLE